METTIMWGIRTWTVLLTAVSAGACGAAQADSGGEASSQEEFVRVINVETVTLETAPFIEEMRLTAVAVANQDVMLAAEERGVVRVLYAERGARVNPGDKIAKIDDGVLSAQVDQARAAAELSAQTWDRRRRLWEQDEVGSEIAYLEARFGAEQAEASLAALEERLARTVIRAPFGGVLEDRFVDVGAMVSPGEPIARLVDLDPVKVFAGVPERYATDVRIGANAIMSFDALGEDVYEAPIRYVGSTVDPQNRTFPIEVEVPNPSGAIKPQMVADMGVTRRQVESAVVVPQDALVRVEDGYVLYIVVGAENGPVAEVRVVELGPTRRNLVVIERGVSGGERLVVVGQRSLAHGDRVNVVNSGQ